MMNKPKKKRFSNFSVGFKIPIIIPNFNFNCLDVLDLRFLTFSSLKFLRLPLSEFSLLVQTWLLKRVFLEKLLNHVAGRLKVIKMGMVVLLCIAKKEQNGGTVDLLTVFLQIVFAETILF